MLEKLCSEGTGSQRIKEVKKMNAVKALVWES